MRIPKLNLRKKRERKSENPLKSDPILLEIFSRLHTINDYDSFEKWRCEFLKRFKSFLVDEGIERSEQSHNVRLRIKVEKMVRNISKIAHHVNDGSLSLEQVTVPARNSLDDGMKSCEDLSTYLKLFSNLAECDENASFTNYSMGAVLVQTGFKEYERLNMCRDILQVLRANFINSVAELQHLIAFDKYEQEMISFKSIVLEDAGLLPVLKKQRQLKSPDPPKALIAEIRKGALREALISKSMVARQAAQAGKSSQENSPSRQIVEKSDFDENRIVNVQEKQEANHSSDSFLVTERASFNEAIEKEQCVIDTEREKMSILLKNRNPLEKSSLKEASKTGSRMKKGDSRSPARQRPTWKSQRRLLKQDADDTRERTTSQSPSREKKKSKKPNFDLLDCDLKVNQSQARRRDERSGNVTVPSPQNSSTPAGELVNAETNTIKDDIREEKGPSALKSLCVKNSTIERYEAGYLKEGIAMRDEESDPLKFTTIGSGDVTRSVVRKENAKSNIKIARKGKQSMKNIARGRNNATTGRGPRGLRKNNFSVEPVPFMNEKFKDSFEVNHTDLKFETLSQDDTVNLVKGKKSTRNTSIKKNANQNNPHIGSTITKLLSESIMSSKENGDAPKDVSIQANELHRRTKPVRSKSSKQKKNSSTLYDYKKIIHGEAYSQDAKKEIPVFDIQLSSLPSNSKNGCIQEPSQSTENNSVDSKLEKIQMEQGKKLSSKIVLSLLDNCGNLNHDGDDLVKVQDLCPNKKSDRLHTKRTKTERRQQLLGHILSESASISFNRDNLQNREQNIKRIDRNDNNLIGRPSFYENFIKPLTSTEQDSKFNNGGEGFHDKQLWEKGKDIFEDSVCSSKYISGNNSLAKAITKFYSDESVVELLRLNNTKIVEQEDNTGEKQNKGDSEVMTSSSEGEVEEIMTEMFERLVIIKERKRRIEKIKQPNYFVSEPDFFGNKHEYGACDQTKEILIAEEEATRMANEVSKLRIALQDDCDLDVLSNEEDGSIDSDEYKWRFEGGEDLVLPDEMHRLFASGEKVICHSEFHSKDQDMNIEDTSELNDKQLDLIKMINRPNTNEDNHLTSDPALHDEHVKAMMTIDDGGLAAEILRKQTSQNDLMKKATMFDDDIDGGESIVVLEMHDEGSDMSEYPFDVKVRADILITNSDIEDNMAAYKRELQPNKELEMAEVMFRIEVRDDDQMPGCAELDKEDETNDAIRNNTSRIKEAKKEHQKIDMILGMGTNEDEQQKNQLVLNEEVEKGNIATCERNFGLKEYDSELERLGKNIQQKEDKLLKDRFDRIDRSDESSLGLKGEKEEFDMVENILKIEACQNNLLVDNEGEIYEDVWKGERKVEKFNLAEENIARITKEDKCVEKANATTLTTKELDQDFNVAETIFKQLEIEDECESKRKNSITANSEGAYDLGSHYEEFNMIEKMIQLEASDDAEESFCFRVIERKPSRNFEGVWTNASSEVPGSEGEDTLTTKCYSQLTEISKYGEQLNPTITNETSKKLEHPSPSSFGPKDILQASPRDNGSQKGSASKHTRKKGIGRSSLVPGKSVRTLDPSTRLSRWQVPQNDYSRSSSYRNIKL